MDAAAFSVLLSVGDGDGDGGGWGGVSTANPTTTSGDFSSSFSSH